VTLHSYRPRWDEAKPDPASQWLDEQVKQIDVGRTVYHHAFDRALCSLVLHFVPQAEKATAEMKRVSGAAVLLQRQSRTIWAVCQVCE
jgi:ubiquinone/menaquinone biosynthesis C-methylase UbiE